MKVWITNISTSKFAGINTLWAAMMREDFIPDKVHLIHLHSGKVDKESQKTARIGYLNLLKRYANPEKLVLHDYDETKFSNIARDMQSLVREEKSEGNTVAIDMTPGRKFMSAFSMYMGVGLGLEHKADKIYYLHVKELGQYSGLPFPMIPSNLMTLYDLKKEVTGK